MLSLLNTAPGSNRVATIQIDGASIHYLKEGTGPAVVLLHSLGGHAEMWRSTIDALRKSFTVIAPDARGHGNSALAEPVTVERFAQDAIAIADALGIPRFGVMGISMGGQAAMHIAAKASERVNFLIAADTSLGAAGKGTDRVAETEKRIAELGPRAFAEEYTRSRLQKTTPDQAMHAFSDMVVKTLPDVYVTQLRSILSQDLRPHVSKIRCPALVVVGANDVSTPVAAATALRDAIPGARLEIIENANHLSNIDQPERFNAVTSAFASASSAS